MTDAMDTADTAVTGVSEARLTWEDGEDEDLATSGGWVLRWRDGSGALHAREIAATRTESLYRLAEQVEGAIAGGAYGWLGATVTIRVICEEYRREMKVVDGEVTSWTWSAR